MIWKFSQAPDNSSISPFKLSNIVIATSLAVTLFISLNILVTPSAPSRIRIIPPRIASEPNISYNVASCSSFVIPFNLSCNRPAISANVLTLPCWSKKALVPFSVRRFNLLKASICVFVFGIKLDNIVFREVPASEPFKPFCANTANVVFVSSKLTPAPEATAEHIDNAYLNSCTSVAEAFAAPAKIFAAWVASFTLNAFIAVLIVSADSAKSKPPAVAKLSAASDASPNTSFNCTPAFINSVIPFATSVFPNTVSCPSCIARALTWDIISSRVCPSTPSFGIKAFIADNCVSKSIGVFIVS